MKDGPDRSLDAAQTQVRRTLLRPLDSRAAFSFRVGTPRRPVFMEFLREWMRASDERLTHASSIDALFVEDLIRGTRDRRRACVSSASVAASGENISQTFIV